MLHTRVRNMAAMALMVGCGLATGAALAVDPAVHNAQKDPRLPHYAAKAVALNISSGVVKSPTAGTQPKVVWAKEVSVAGASWLRLYFKDVQLAGGDDLATTSYVRITNLTEKAVQFLDARSMAQWSNSSCYLNGDRVLVEILARPGTGENRLTIASVEAGDPNPAPGGITTICGPVDNRVLSSDDRCARILPAGCSGWMIDDANHMFLAAGHCGTTGSSVVQFNVPLSTGTGALVNPPPEDQYPVDGTSKQGVNGGIGNDWEYFGAFPNSNTNLTPYQAQGDFFVTINAPAAANQTTRITGYGTTDQQTQPAPLTWNQVQKTHTGPYTAKVGTTLRYQVDTTGGNSGSPIFLDSNDQAFGIHTNAGCADPTGNTFNSGTDLANAGLQSALNAPQGICAPLGVGDPTGPLYFAGDSTFDTFGTVNRATGLYGVIGPGTSGDISSWQGLAYNRVDNVMYATAQVSGTVRLYTVNIETGQVSFVGPTNDSGGTNIFIEGLAYDPNGNILYGYSQTTSILHIINKATGAVSNLGGAQANVQISGIDFDPITNKLYGIDDNPAAGSRLVTISTNNGTVLPINGSTTLGVGETDCDSLAFSPDDGYCYTVDQATNELIRIDPSTGAGVIIGNLDQPNFDGGLASVAGDCSRPIQPTPTNPLNGATGVSVNLAALNWESENAVYCGSSSVVGNSPFSDATPFRGSLLEIYTAQTMTEIKMDLQFVGNKPITWTAYEFEEGSGTGQLIFADTQTEIGTGGRKQYTSGAISIPMKANHWYAVGFHSAGPAGDVTYFRDSGIPAGNTGAYGLYQGGCGTNALGAAPPATVSFATISQSAPTNRFAMEFCFDPRCYNVAPNAAVSFANVNVMRGNTYRFDQNQTLTEIEADLDFAGAQTVTFVVYEGGDVATPGDLIFSKAVNLNGTGRKLYSSGAIDVALKSDRVYAIGWHKTGNPTYFRSDSVLPVDFQYGEVLAGFGVNTATVPATAAMTLAPATSAYSLNLCFGPPSQRLQTGNLGTDTSATVGNLVRGTVINCEKDTVLESIDMRLALASAQPVNFVVYEANSAGALGSLLTSKTVNFAASAEGWKNSGAMNVPLEKGKVYLIGMQKVSTDITYFFENTTDFVKFYDFGTVLGGFTQNGIPNVPPTLTVTPDIDTIYTTRMNFSCETWYDVFFGTNPNPPKTGRTSLTIAGLGAFLPLNAGTDYYWRVQAHNCCGFRNSDGPFKFTTEVSCYPDCDGNGTLNIDDFICFQTFYAIGDKYADCDGSGSLNIDDFICFQTFYAIGC